MEVYEVNVLLRDDMGDAHGTAYYARDEIFGAPDPRDSVSSIGKGLWESYLKMAGGTSRLRASVLALQCEMLDLGDEEVKHFEERIQPLPLDSINRWGWMRVIIGSPPEYPDGGSANGTFQGR